MAVLRDLAVLDDEIVNVVERHGADLKVLECNIADDDVAVLVAVDAVMRTTTKRSRTKDLHVGRGDKAVAKVMWPCFGKEGRGC